MSKDLRLPRRFILRRRQDFQEIFKKGKRWRGRRISIYYLKAEIQRVGFFVPKRIGKAVIRNRMKRWMREVYRIHRSEIPPTKMIIIAASFSKFVDYREIEKDFKRFVSNMQGKLL